VDRSNHEAPVAKAIEKGVQVELLLRAQNRRDRHRRDAGLLHRLGVRVVADDLNHAKAVIADDRAAVLFSANFDADHGLDTGGIEVGARLDSTSALPQMRHYFDHAIATATATREYIDHPTSQQLHERLAEKWQRPWPLANRINVQPQQDAWERLTDGTQNGPVLWRREPGQAVELLAGVERFQLAPAKNSKPTCKPGSTPGTRTETVRVDQNRRRDPRQPGKLLHPDTYDANFRLRTLRACR